MTLAQYPSNEKPRAKRHRSPNGTRHPNADFRAPASIVEAVRAEAARRGVTFSEVAREALEAYVAALANGRELAEPRPHLAAHRDPPTETEAVRKADMAA